MPSRTFIAREQKAMPGFKISKDRLNLLLVSDATGDCKLKPMLIYPVENPRDLKNNSKPTLPVLSQWNNKSWTTAHLFTIRFTKYFKPTVGICLEKKDSFQNITDHRRCTWSTKSFEDDVQQINIVFLLANTTIILQHMDKGVISTFTSYYLKNIFCKAIAALVLPLVDPGKLRCKRSGEDLPVQIPLGTFLIHSQVSE